MSARIIFSAIASMAVFHVSTTAFTVPLQKPAKCMGEMDRRDATMATAGFFLSSLVAVPSQAKALDLLKYEDGPRSLKYLVTETGNGSGVKPQRGQKVKTSYTLYVNGFEEDGGKKVDSSKGFLGDKPFEFMVGVSQVIKGWDLCLMDMEEGEARRLIVPSDLGYGEKGAGADIAGGATLYFDVKLNEIGKSPNLNEKQLKWLDENPL
mmetsp:Transcript_9935/g.14626  ORF Transcript_9935/g.14626 Transcript_9935/m.14626 type:complete len:208 (-) Transcript_9935:116-739(-)|eukprot:CAMPEP_0194212942 /NCGR_PEP_ID=MMETSP0156-20130528/13144_1 /TAXON_ID=33649 /ORGANISM="Thalassionema nitzschioides, Strain L26-B" /LENGTH=207 /DNA_ID=CAMNT_0038940853 /DNA_START=46 /DNA_END=669 /DNA_ORIENTATION=+